MNFSILPYFVLISVCENDFVSYSATGDCYKYFPHLLSWDDARAYCQDNVPYNVGDLASIPDAGTNDFLRTLVHDAHIWVGGLRDERSSWIWSDGTPWGYSFWFEGQPNNGGGVQSNVAFNFYSSGKWNDEHKNIRNGFVCSYRGGKL